MITLNKYEVRQNVEPLSADDINNVVTNLNQVAWMTHEHPNIQRLIDSYQNLQHFWDVVGGWEGLHKRQESEYNKGIEHGFIKASEGEDY